MVDVMYQTRETMFNQDIQTPKRKYDVQQSIFDEIQGLECLIYFLHRNKH